jgi:ribosomal protein S16
MHQEFFESIEKAISTERLSPYGRDNPGPCAVMARYLWNIAICESLYSPLQMCEVALRNSIHATMSEIFKVGTWYDTISLMSWAHGQIGGAKSKIATAGKPVTPGRVVAELHFGFWTSLFEDHYEKNTPFLPTGIKKVFPCLAKSLHNRKDIKGRLERVRQLRNCVFHHERVIHWKDLSDQHARVIETIGWISPGLSEMALKLDRFLETYKAGIDPWIAKLRNHWPAKPAPGAGGVP